MGDINERQAVSAYHHGPSNLGRVGRYRPHRGHRRVAGIPVTPDLDPDAVYGRADKMIGRVLDEGRKQLASIDKNATEAQRRRFERRQAAFDRMDQTRATYPITMGKEPENPYPKGTFTQSADQVFGPARFKSPVREMSLKHLLPLLAYHRDLGKNSDEIRQAAKDEFDRHVGVEIRRVSKAARRNLKKLKAGGVDYTSGLKNLKKGGAMTFSKGGHEAWEHGYIGALPNYHGEFISGAMSNILNIKDPRNFQADKDYINNVTLRVKGILPEHMKSIPVEHVLAWSKSLRSKGSRGRSR